MVFHQRGGSIKRSSGFGQENTKIPLQSIRDPAVDSLQIARCRREWPSLSYPLRHDVPQPRRPEAVHQPGA
jgi:hypothetical protein